MSEEEAIKRLKCWKETFEQEEYLDFINHGETDVEAFEKVLNLIEKQRKEIEELKKQLSN